MLIATRPIFNAAYRLNLRELPKLLAAVSEFSGWLIVVALAVGLAWGLSFLLNGVGYDARGGLIDTYVQRNALVVAFAIAFAEIPIIYTISEDALNAVPPYLRSGSLACGASKWQTASWIVLPTAAGRYKACFVWENWGRSKLSKCNWAADDLFGVFLGIYWLVRWGKSVS